MRLALEPLIIWAFAAERRRVSETTYTHVTDTVQAALITVGGMLGAGMLGAIIQYAITRQVIAAEHLRTLGQVREESQRRVSERILDRIVDGIAELLVTTDPAVVAQIDYPGAVKRLHRVQLLLDRNDPTEAALNGRLNALLISLAGFTKHPDGALIRSEATMSDVLRSHGEVIDATQAVVSRFRRSAR